MLLNLVLGGLAFFNHEEIRLHKPGAEFKPLSLVKNVRIRHIAPHPEQQLPRLENAIPRLASRNYLAEAVPALESNLSIRAKRELPRFGHGVDIVCFPDPVLALNTNGIGACPTEVPDRHYDIGRMEQLVVSQFELDRNPVMTHAAIRPIP
jgi:hypothetical protein